MTFKTLSSTQQIIVAIQGPGSTDSLTSSSSDYDDASMISWGSSDEMQESSHSLSQEDTNQAARPIHLMPYGPLPDRPLMGWDSNQEENEEFRRPHITPDSPLPDRPLIDWDAEDDGVEYKPLHLTEAPYEFKDETINSASFGY